MQIWKSIKNFYTKTTGISNSDIIRFFTGSDSDSVFPPMSTAGQLDAMRTNAIVYACVSMKSQAFQQAPLVVAQYNPKEDIWENKDDHLYLKGFQNNPFLSESDIKKYIAMHLDLTGKSFLWKWKNRLDETSEIWPIPPSWIDIATVDISDSNNRVISHYELTVPGISQKYTIPEKDMIYTRYPDPSNLYDGISPLEAASRNVYLDDKGDEYKGEAIDALKVPGLVIKTKKDMNQAQKDDLRAVLMQKMSRDARSSAIVVSGDGADVDILNPMKDFEWSSYSDLNESRICMVFGVPPICIGALVGLKNSPWSNTGDAQRWLYSNTIMGMWNLVATSITRSLIPEKERDLYEITFDTENVSELQEDQELVESRAIKRWESGLITRNEAREMLGEDGSPDGDVYKYKTNDMLVPAGVPIQPIGTVTPINPNTDIVDNTELLGE